MCPDFVILKQEQIKVVRKTARLAMRNFRFYRTDQQRDNLQRARINFSSVDLNQAAFLIRLHNFLRFAFFRSLWRVEDCWRNALNLDCTSLLEPVVDTLTNYFNSLSLYEKCKINLYNVY